MGTLKWVSAVVGQHLSEILKHFKPGFKIAVVIWHPERPRQDFLLLHPTATLGEVLETVERRKTDPETRTGRTQEL